MATKVYCDICGLEIIEPTKGRYDLSIRIHDNWESSYQYYIEDICHTCYLDIVEQIERKKKFYRDKHEMEDVCKTNI